MTTDLWMLTWSAFLCVMVPFVYVGGLGQVPGGLAWGFGNRDKPLELPPWAARAKRAHANLVENLAPFAVLVLVAHVAGKGNAKGPLDNVGAKLKADEIREWIVDAPGMTAKTKAARKPAMKAYTLPKEDVDALVAYMASLKK